MANKKVLIIVPAYNEGANIQRTIQDLRSVTPEFDILVVDDGSADDTALKARAAGVVVTQLPFNLGIGGAVQTGFQYAQTHGYDIAVQFDGDGQHEAGYLNALIAPVAEGKMDIAVGSRFIHPDNTYKSSFVRRIGIHFFAHLISFLTQYQITDPTSGFRAFNRRVIAVFAEDYPSDFPEPESIVIASRYGLRLAEVPVEMRKRQGGVSSIRYFNTLYYMVKVTFAILLNMIKRKKERN